MMISFFILLSSFLRSYQKERYILCIYFSDVWRRWTWNNVKCDLSLFCPYRLSHSIFSSFIVSKLGVIRNWWALPKIKNQHLYGVYRRKSHLIISLPLALFLNVQRHIHQARVVLYNTKCTILTCSDFNGSGKMNVHLCVWSRMVQHVLLVP